MDIITTEQPSRGLIDSHVLSTGKTEAFLNGKIDKESIYVKGINYTLDDAEIKADSFLAQITIKTKLKTLKSYARAFDKRLSTIEISQDDVKKDCVASKKLNVVAEKMTFNEKQDVVVKLKPKVTGKTAIDASSIVFCCKIANKLPVGVGVGITTDGVVEFKKNKLKVSGCTYIELFTKVITGVNPINKAIELDENKMLENIRGQIYLLESELYDVIKMKHLMDIDKETILD